MARRRLALALAITAALPVAADDLAPWEIPQAPAASGPGGPAPSEPGASDDAAAAFAEILALELSREDADRMRQDTPEGRATFVQQEWAKASATKQARVRWAAKALRENGSVATPRAIALLVLGPPVAIHSEPARDFGSVTVDHADPSAVAARLLGKPVASQAPAVAITGSRPAEIWVYPAKSLKQLRVLTFAGDAGRFLLAKDELVDAGAAISTSPAIEPPADLVAPEAARTLEPLPELTNEALPIGLASSFFKASLSRTFTRFVLTVDPSDVELHLDGKPDEFGAAAEAFLRVERDGAGVWQGRAALKDAGAPASTPWLLDLSTPLLPGTYDVTALVTDGKGAGGRKSERVTVPAFGGRLALSSPVVAKVTDGALPKAAESDEEALAPFQVGTYIVRPQPGGSFRRGDTLAIVVQVYDAPSATIEYDLWFGGELQGSIPAVEIKKLPSTQILLQDITDQYPEGRGEMRITVQDPRAPTEKVTVAAPFRVRG